MGGPPDVHKMRDKGDFKGLTKALRYKDSWYVRELAASALGELGDSRAIAPLTAALSDNALNVRLAAVEALSTFDAPAVESICSVLKVSDLAEKAAKALGRVGDPRAVGPLGDMLMEGIHPAVAAEALGKIGTPAVEALLNAVRAADPEVRGSAVKGLGKIGDPRAVEPLLAAIEGDVENRYVVIEALANIGDRRAMEPLTKCLSDKRQSVRWVTALALNQFGWKPNSIESELAYAIARGDWNRCVEIGTPAVESLISVLQDEEAKYSRNQAAMALGMIGDPQAIEALGIALRDNDVTIVGAAAEALGKIGTPDVVEVLGKTLKGESIHPFACKWIAEALVGIGTSEAIQALGSALTTGSTLTVRKCAAEALAGIEHPQALTALMVGLRDRDGDVRYIAVSAIDKQGDARAIMPLIEAIGDERIGSLVIGALRSVLRRHASEVDPEALRAVLNVGNVVNLRSNPHYCANDPDSVAAFRENVDSSEVKQLARQELIRRGFEA